MLKLLHRIVALLLISALVADPSWAMAWSKLPVLSLQTYTVFEREAIPAAPAWMMKALSVLGWKDRQMAKLAGWGLIGVFSIHTAQAQIFPFDSPTLPSSEASHFLVHVLVGIGVFSCVFIGLPILMHIIKYIGQRIHQSPTDAVFESSAENEATQTLEQLRLWAASSDKVLAARLIDIGMERVSDFESVWLDGKNRENRTILYTAWLAHPLGAHLFHWSRQKPESFMGQTLQSIIRYLDHLLGHQLLRLLIIRRSFGLHYDKTLALKKITFPERIGGQTILLPILELEKNSFWLLYINPRVWKRFSQIWVTAPLLISLSVYELIKVLMEYSFNFGVWGLLKIYGVRKNIDEIQEPWAFDVDNFPIRMVHVLWYLRRQFKLPVDSGDDLNDKNGGQGSQGGNSGSSKNRSDSSEPPDSSKLMEQLLHEAA